MSAIGNNTDYIREKYIKDQYIETIEQQLKENPEQTIKEIFEAPIEELEQEHVSDQPSSQNHLLEGELKRNIKKVSGTINVLCLTYEYSPSDKGRYTFDFNLIR